MPELLTAKDFPRWTRSRLGLPPEATLDEEIDRVILRAGDHVRSLVGDEAYDQLAADGSDNAQRRRRFAAALHALVESRLHEVRAEHLGSQAGSSTQGKRARTTSPQAAQAAEVAAARAYRRFAEDMFQLGHTVRQQALGVYHTPTAR